MNAIRTNPSLGLLRRRDVDARGGGDVTDQIRSHTLLGIFAYILYSELGLWTLCGFGLATWIVGELRTQDRAGHSSPFENIFVLAHPTLRASQPLRPLRSVSV